MVDLLLVQSVNCCLQLLNQFLGFDIFNFCDLHTFRADIDYCQCEALTKVGLLGIKVWICRGEVYGKADLTPNFTADNKGNNRGNGRSNRGGNRKKNNNR